MRDPVTNAVIGYEAQFQGSVRVVRGPEGPDAVATVQATQSPQEMGAGSLLLPQPPRELVRYVPHAPDADVQARIAAVYGLSLIHISEPTRLHKVSRMPSSA